MFSTVYQMFSQDSNDILNEIPFIEEYNIKDEFDMVNDIFNTGKVADRKC